MDELHKNYNCADARQRQSLAKGTTNITMNLGLQKAVTTMSAVISSSSHLKEASIS